MSPYAAPKPPKPPIPTLDVVPEVEAIPDEDHASDVIELVSLKDPPPPIPVHRRERIRRSVIGVGAMLVGIVALTLAFHPWRRAPSEAHAAPMAQATIAATVAKRTKPAAPPPKATVVVAQKKNVATAKKKAKPAAKPVKPVAKPPTKNS